MVGYACDSEGGPLKRPRSAVQQLLWHASVRSGAVALVCSPTQTHGQYVYVTLATITRSTLRA